MRTPLSARLRSIGTARTNEGFVESSSYHSTRTRSVHLIEIDMRFIGLFLLLLSPAALAGDPCPIPFTVYEHTPAWRERATDLAALQSQDDIMGVRYQGLKFIKVDAQYIADILAT